MNKRRAQKKRRNYRKRKNTNYANSKMIIYRNPGGKMFMPPRFRTVLALNAMAQIPVGLGSRSTYHICKLNSIVVPFNLGVQSFVTAPGAPLLANLYPAGYDKLSSIYSTYRVTASMIEVSVLPTTAADEIVYAICPALPGAAPLSIDQIDGVNHSKGPQFSSTYFKTKLRKYLRVRDIIGNNIQGDLTTLSAAMNADPAYILRWDFGYRTLSNADVTTTVSIAIKLKYWIDCYDIKSNNIEPGS